MKLSFISRLIGFLRSTNNTSNTFYQPRYRVLEIFKDEEDKYTVLIQIINKSTTFYAKPEEILADDNFVDYLSPRDVRTLTYLGYLEINQPEYKILAQRLSENCDIFIMKKRGNKKPIVKTAIEIAKETEILLKISSQDAKTIGYAIANSEFNKDKIEKDSIRKDLDKKINAK